MTGRHAADVPDEEVAEAPGIPTQIAHPVRALVRTLVAAGIAVVVALLARWGIDVGHLAEGLTEVVTGVVVLLGVGVVQWLLTRPVVERWLRAYVPQLATGVHTEQ